MRKKIWTANDLAHSFAEVDSDPMEAGVGGKGDEPRAEFMRLGGEGSEGGEGGAMPAFIRFGAEGGEG